MKKIIFALLLFVPLTYCNAQFNSIDKIKQRMLGKWQNLADSTDRLVITPDNIQVIDSGKVRITYTYTFSNEACNNGLKLPAGTGVYLVETYDNKTVCCALGEVGYGTLKITYPGNKQVSYFITSELPPTPKN